VTAGGPPAARWLRCDAAELGEGAFVADALGVVAGGDEELAGELDPDVVGFDLAVRRLDLLVEGLPSACQVAERGLQDLITAIDRFTNGWNERCHPLVWAETADELLDHCRTSQRASLPRH
jgi:hypothetical protein